MAFENLKKAGITMLLSKLKVILDATYQKLAEAVKTVNGTLPDEYGNVAINRVNYAGDLESSFSQNADETFIQRTSGGSASISDGDAWLSAVLGNSEHTGFVEKFLDVDVRPISDENPITATWDEDEFFSNDDLPSSPITLAYSSSWNTDPATYGITVSGTPSAGDQIIITYVREVPGTITNATPTSFVSTGWNLYQSANGYAKVVKYSDDYGYRITGDYTGLQFSATVDGQKTALSDDDGWFMPPEDGFVWVTGGNASNTAIWATQEDWADEYAGDFEGYTSSSVDLSSVMNEYFPYGLCKVGNVADEINLSLGVVYLRIEQYENTPANMAIVKASGRLYEYDETTIYVVKPTPSSYSIEASGAYSADDHGTEYFVGTSVPAEAVTIYGINLKNKLERDVLTISQQTLTASQQTQARKNIGAPSVSDVNVINTNLASLFKYKYYEKTIASLANATGTRMSASDMGFSTPSGYKPLALVRYTSGTYKVATSYVNILATGDTNAIGIFNSSGSTQTSFKIGVGILYVKTGFGI